MTTRPIIAECIAVGPLEENSYILYRSIGGDALLVDPGDEAGRILGRIAALGLEIKAVLLTHAHLDHWAALPAILNKMDLPVYLHPEDRFLLKHAVNQNLAESLGWTLADIPMLPLIPGPMNIGVETFDVIHTPGHTPGSVVFRFNEILLTGDTLFAGGIGRTDLPGGNGKTLFESLAQFKKMPMNYRIFPGHGESSDLMTESRYNPFW